MVQFKSEHPVLKTSDVLNMSKVEVCEKKGEKSSILKCIKHCTKGNMMHINNTAQSG